MAPLKLYGMPLSPNVVRVATALNEKGLDFEIVPIDLRTGAHKQPEFLALNPFGQIPALEDGDEVLYESRAINRYIATKYKSDGPDLVPTPSAKLEVWLEVESQHFYPNVSPLVFQLLIKPLLGGAPDPEVVDKHAHELAKVLDIYEAHLAQNKYLAGDEFTLADLNHMSYLLYLSKTPKAELVTSRPHVKAWWEDISARPAFQKTVAAIPLPSA
ncbi:glutathione S-transferase 3-like [Phragmites australis]|uniref:glutathione S-transferase 3-like n=1 Tax=Phragmites australis TaxID=29695 RepID=UPI002D78FF42|nr:glutathione S-transferase 3-like [Phragmites australis]